MFKVDLHVHTTLGGDSALRPEEVVGQARRAGLDAVCITEHHAYDLSQPFERIAALHQYPIFRGFEYRAAEGHLLIYGVRAGKGDFLPGLPMQMVIDGVNRRAGVAIPAHPYQNGLIGCALGDRVMDLKGIVALETVNGSVAPEENRYAQEAADRLGLKGIGGSDAHGLHALGSAFTCFHHPLGNEADLVAALRSGAYFPQSANGRAPV